MADHLSSDVANLLNHRDIRGNSRDRLFSARVHAYLLRKRLMKKIRNAPVSQKIAIAGHNRRVKDIARRPIRNVRFPKSGNPKGYNEVDVSVLLARYRESLLMGGILANRHKQWIPISQRLKKRSFREIVVEDFSFISNPQGTIETLAQLASAEAECLDGKIHFLDERCKDIGAWLALAAIREEMAPVFSGGIIKNEMQKLLVTVQLDKKLRFDVRPAWEEGSPIWAFPLQTRRAAGSSQSPTFLLDPQHKEKVAGDLTEALNEWLMNAGSFELSSAGTRMVDKIVSECLDNAERHSRPEFENDGDWLISGFMVPASEDGKQFRCHLGFLSLGSSIAESVLGCTEDIANEMNAYVAQHERKAPNHTRQDEHLRTVYALQDFVTRDRDALSSGRGGTGFRDILLFFGDLSGSLRDKDQACLTIVSGHTCLHIRTQHTEAARVPEGVPFYIWLNNDNDRNSPPDNDAIVELDRRFAGTLVTLVFTLDRDHLERLANDEN